jgi:hypothetical protein
VSMTPQDIRQTVTNVVEEAKLADRNKMVPMMGIVTEHGTGEYEGMVRIRRTPHEPEGAPERPFYFVFGNVPDIDAQVFAMANFATGIVRGDIGEFDPLANAAAILAALLTVDGAGSLLDADKLDGVEGAGYLPTSHAGSGGAAHAAVTPTVAGFASGSDKSKLDGIETGATTDQSATEIRSALITVDGFGSGIDADMVDGQHANAFALSGHDHGINFPEPAVILPDTSLIAGGHHEATHGLGGPPRFIFAQVRETASSIWKLAAEGIAPGPSQFSIGVDATKIYIDNNEALTVVYRIFLWP